MKSTILNLNKRVLVISGFKTDNIYEQYDEIKNSEHRELITSKKYKFICSGSELSEEIAKGLVHNDNIINVELLTQQEIEKHFEKCDFDDECDFCDNPKHGSYVKLYHEPEGVTETEFYICGKCASKRLESYEKEENEHWEAMGNMADWWAKEQQNKKV